MENKKAGARGGGQPASKIVVDLIVHQRPEDQQLAIWNSIADLMIYAEEIETAQSNFLRQFQNVCKVLKSLEGEFCDPYIGSKAQFYDQLREMEGEL
jgi:hypothetical protein